MRQDLAVYSDIDQPFLVWGAYAPLVGSVQSIPRAELFAIWVVVSMVQSGNLEIASDSKVNVDVFLRGRDACRLSENADLWLLIWQKLDEGHVVLSLRWIKGHAAQDPEMYIKYNVQVVDAFGNGAADALANRAACDAEVSTQDYTTFFWYVSLVKKIQARAVIILSTALERDASPMPCRLSTREQPTFAVAMSSQHKCALFAGHLHCTACFQSISATDRGVKQWLRQPCVPNANMIRAITFGTTRPTELPHGQAVRIGRSMTHSDHKLLNYRGLYFCGLCGYYAAGKAQKLLGPCTSRGKKAVTRVLALRAGRLPSGLNSWPNCRSNTGESMVVLD